MEFFVPGKPVSKGSWATTPAGGFYPMDPRTRAWEQHIKGECRKAMFRCGRDKIEEGAVAVRLAFFLRPPKKTRRKYPNYPTGKNGPDGDKLARCVLDGLEGVLYANDSQVARLSSVKVYVGGLGTAGVVIDTEGVHIWARAMEGQ